MSEMRSPVTSLPPLERVSEDHRSTNSHDNNPNHHNHELDCHPIWVMECDGHAISW